MEKKYEFTDKIDIVYKRRFFNFLFDKILSVCLLSNQVPRKHLKIPSGLVAEIISLLNIKDFDSLYAVAYNGLVGCSYTIQYPHGKGVTTDLVPCFLAPGTLLECQ